MNTKSNCTEGDNDNYKRRDNKHMNAINGIFVIWEQLYS